MFSQYAEVGHGGAGDQIFSTSVATTRQEEWPRQGFPHARRNCGAKWVALVGQSGAPWWPPVEMTDFAGQLCANPAILGVMNQPYFLSEPISEVEIIDVPSTPLAAIQFTEYSLQQMDKIMDPAFAALGAAIQAGNISPVGPAVAKYNSMGEDPSAPIDVEVGFPVAGPIPAGLTVNGLNIESRELPEAKVARISYFGAYEGLAGAWQKLTNDFMAEGWNPLMPCWEFYITMPTPDTDPSQLRTDLYCVVDNTLPPAA